MKGQMKAWTVVTTRGVWAAHVMHKVPGSRRTARERADTCLVIKPAGSSCRTWHRVSSDRDEGPLPDLLQTPGAASLWRTAGLRRPSVLRTLCRLLVLEHRLLTALLGSLVPDDVEAVNRAPLTVFGPK